LISLTEQARCSRGRPGRSSILLRQLQLLHELSCFANPFSGIPANGDKPLLSKGFNLGGVKIDTNISESKLVMLGGNPTGDNN